MKQRLGSEPRTGDHGKWVCGVRALLQRPGCVVYSVGSGGFAGEMAKSSLTLCTLPSVGTYWMQLVAPIHDMKQGMPKSESGPHRLCQAL